MLTLSIIIVAILALSGFFSGSEAALLTLTDADTETLLQKKRLGARILKKVEDNIDRSVITIVVFNNIANIVGSIVVGQMVIELYGDAVLAVITTALTFGIIIFSEIIPKSLGIHYAENVALVAAPVIYLLTAIIQPIIIGLEKLTNLFKKGERKVGTEQQIRSLVTIGRRSGHIETDEGQLIHRAFILNDKTAEDIMTPLKDIVSFQEEDSIAQAVEKMEGHVHSRYPVFGTSIHEVIGIAMQKELLESLLLDKGNESITNITRDPLVVPHTIRSDKLLSLFRDRHIHLAVVQEDDHTAGLVTLEDVLEELVGDIEDETDVED